MVAGNSKKVFFGGGLVVIALACWAIVGKLGWEVSAESPELPKNVVRREGEESGEGGFLWEVMVAGPELRFRKAGSRRLFLIAPNDIRIGKAIFELENKPVEDAWVTYSVRELFTELGKWGLANYDEAFWTYLVLSNTQDQGSIARGFLNVETPGRYEVEVVVCQNQRSKRPEDNGRKIQLMIDETSVLVVPKGPSTVRTWEKWGEIELGKGRHAISLGAGPGLVGSWEIGPVRIRRIDAAGSDISSLRELRIANYFNGVPPTGYFETSDISASLRSASRNTSSPGISGRYVCPLSVSCICAGVLRIRSLKVSFFADEGQVPEKAGQFVLIYPDGDSSRPVTLEDLRVFASYVRGVVDSAKGRRRNPSELVGLCGLVKEVSLKCKARSAKRIAGEFENRHHSLAREEAEKLAWSFQGYANDWPKPVDFPSRWAETLVVWYRGGLDETRLSDDGGYLDPWGHPYRLNYFPEEKRVRIHSYGANGKDENGSGDDLVAEHELEWFE
jgi:hypothetical protein